MPLLGFKSRFAPAVENGTKRQTMRARRKDGRDPKPGDTLYLYTGLRTKSCRRLRVEICTKVKPIVVDERVIRLNDRFLTHVECAAFAKADGFGSFDEMIDWMANEAGREFPWSGVVVYW